MQKQNKTKNTIIIALKNKGKKQHKQQKSKKP